jgi:hypothetical protein
VIRNGFKILFQMGQLECRYVEEEARRAARERKAVEARPRAEAKAASKAAAAAREASETERVEVVDEADPEEVGE